LHRREKFQFLASESDLPQHLRDIELEDAVLVRVDDNLRELTDPPKVGSRLRLDTLCDLSKAVRMSSADFSRPADTSTTKSFHLGDMKGVDSLSAISHKIRVIRGGEIVGCLESKNLMNCSGEVCGSFSHIKLFEGGAEQTVWVTSEKVQNYMDEAKLNLISIKSGAEIRCAFTNKDTRMSITTRGDVVQVRRASSLIREVVLHGPVRVEALNDAVIREPEVQMMDVEYEKTFDW
jgi:hypothetical protein